MVLARRGTFFEEPIDVVDGQLSGGLGQLVDGDEGVANFRLDSQNVGRRGYEWVAWKTTGGGAAGRRRPGRDYVPAGRGEVADGRPCPLQ